MVLVVRMAAMVPIGIDFWASFRSPDRLDPAIIPATHTHTHTHTLGILKKFASSSYCTLYMYNTSVCKDWPLTEIRALNKQVCISEHTKCNQLVTISSLPPWT